MILVTQPGLVLRVTGEVVWPLGIGLSGVPGLAESHERMCVPPLPPFPHHHSQARLDAVPSMGGRVGGSNGPPLPGCQSDLLGPFKSSRPNGRHRGVIPACPGWTRVELMLTSGTRPVGPIRPPSAPGPAHSPAQRPSWPRGRGRRRHKRRKRHRALSRKAPCPASVSHVAWVRPPRPPTVRSRID